MSEGEFHFIHPDGAPGQLHQMLGDAGFKSYLDTQQATAECNTLAANAYAALTIAKAKRQDSITALFHTICIIAIACGIPVAVHLWRWAL